MKTTKATATAKKVTAINAVIAQSGEIAITVQTRKASAKTIKQLAPLVSAMQVAGEDTSAELLARLPQDTVAFKCFAQNATSTAQLFAWFSSNQERLTRKTRENKVLLNVAGAYCAAFDISHDRAIDGPLKQMPFYKRFSNALQQWAKMNGGVEKRASGSTTDVVGAYLNKKQQENADGLSDSIVAWVLKHEAVLQRILDSKAV